MVKRGGTKSRHAVKHDGSLLQLIDRLSDCLTRFAARACSVPIDALTFCRPADSASICFCWRAMVAPVPHSGGAL